MSDCSDCNYNDGSGYGCTNKKARFGDGRQLGYGIEKWSDYFHNLYTDNNMTDYEGFDFIKDGICTLYKHELEYKLSKMEL